MLQTVDADAKAEEITNVDFLTIAVSGSSCYCAAAADAATDAVMDSAEMTAACGSSFCSSAAAADAVTDSALATAANHRSVKKEGTEPLSSALSFS